MTTSINTSENSNSIDSTIDLNDDSAKLLINEDVKNILIDILEKRSLGLEEKHSILVNKASSEESIKSSLTNDSVPIVSNFKMYMQGHVTEILDDEVLVSARNILVNNSKEKLMAVPKDEISIDDRSMIKLGVPVSWIVASVIKNGTLQNISQFRVRRIAPKSKSYMQDSEEIAKKFNSIFEEI